jgi:hypothetical protein
MELFVETHMRSEDRKKKVQQFVAPSRAERGVAAILD